MWKCISRTIRERRPSCITRPDVACQDTNQSGVVQTSTHNYGDSLTPEDCIQDKVRYDNCSHLDKTWNNILWRKHNKDDHYRKYGHFTPEKCSDHYISVDKKHCFSLSGQPKLESCRWSKHQKNDHERSWDGGPHIHHKHSWLGAVGWSSILVLGWYMIQPLCRLRILPGDSEKKYQASFETGYVSFLNILSKTVLAQPVAESILPKQTVACETTTRHIKQDITGTIDECDGPVQVQSSRLPFGPPTAEEIVNEAAENFAKVQNSLVGDIDNRLGVEYMNMGKHKQAVTHFRRAMAFEHGPAAYNLGVCCEMGLGIKQDFKQAAKYYQLASDRGHATAMYNLGVFYVHGWGGLPVDCVRAQGLFEKASELGQVDATKALEMKNSRKSSPPKEPESTELFLQALGIGQHVAPVKEAAMYEDIYSTDDDFVSEFTLNESSKVDQKNISQLIQDSIFKYTALMQK